jgi:uncharacterized repeat protein (TIGR03803 family)
MQGKRNSCVFLSSRRTSVDRFGRLFRLIVSAIVLLTVLGPASAAYGQNYRVFYRLHTRWCCATLTSPMTQGRDGNLYLTNLGGITEGEGFYRITPAGNIDLLYGFNTVALQGPSSAPVLGTDGNFYGSASSGGTYSFGTVYQMTPLGAQPYFTTSRAARTEHGHTGCCRAWMAICTVSAVVCLLEALFSGSLAQEP